MKHSMSLLSSVVTALVLMLSARPVTAAVSDELEQLGSDQEVKREVEKMSRRSRVSIVQNRSVSRDWRLELAGNYGPVAAGDSYLFTQNIGGQAELHITPKVSLGVRYARSYNSLTPEGKLQFDQARAAKLAGALDYAHPEIDYPEESVIGTLSWYMLYGKINFFDLRVVQFDIYSLAGGGQMKLSLGSTNTWTAGGGIAFWLGQHVSSRMELRYQTYADHLEPGGRKLDLAVASVGLGVLL